MILVFDVQDDKNKIAGPQRLIGKVFVVKMAGLPSTTEDPPEKKLAEAR